MLVREMVRRCKYEPTKIITIIHWLNQANAVVQDIESVSKEQLSKMGQLGKLIYLFNETNFLTVRICDYIFSITDVLQMSYHHRARLLKVLTKMVQYNPFDIVVIHDCFTCLPCNMNYVRYWYNDMLANLIESKVLQHILNQLTPEPFQLHWNPELRIKLAERVRNEGNYSIC